MAIAALSQDPNRYQSVASALLSRWPGPEPLEFWLALASLLARLDVDGNARIEKAEQLSAVDYDGVLSVLRRLNLRWSGWLDLMPDPPT